MQRDVLFSMIIITFSGFWGLQSFLCKLNSIKMLVINDCQIKGWYKILFFFGFETQINIQFNKNILSLILTYFKYFSLGISNNQWTFLQPCISYLLLLQLNISIYHNIIITLTNIILQVLAKLLSNCHRFTGSHIYKYKH